MNKQNIVVGIFVAVAAVLFTVGLFLIGNQHKAFRRHVEFYTEFSNLDGIAKGAKVRVAGMDGGQILDIQVPDRPSQKFRLKLQIEENLHGLIRQNSFVSIETSGIVGDEFLLIHAGTDQSPEAPSKSTLRGKEPIELAALIEKASGLMNQVGGTLNTVQGAIGDVQGHLNGTLDAVKTTVNNTNGIVTGIRSGRGAAGVLLEDPITASNVKQAVANGRQATVNLNQATVKVNSLIDDFSSRNLGQKTEDTLNNAKNASQQLSQTAQQVNQTLATAFGQDQFGEDAGSNLRQTLSNVNQATGNLADDSEALKHEFFFRGFFKKRGYDTLQNIPVSDYREDKLLEKTARHREWLSAGELFETAPDGTETLSATGRDELDLHLLALPNVYGTPIIIEGYAETGTPAQQLVQSRRRAVLVRSYLQIHFHLEPKNLGIVALSAQPPADAGKPTWNGVCLVALTPKH